ncbi:hypothetical protein HK096_002651 [Nowakowskiella sp. JEL0078]|nr:hypothetical protein HK096_002651 [Nowakowskiella sp. JEL0078]
MARFFSSGQQQRQDKKVEVGSQRIGPVPLIPIKNASRTPRTPMAMSFSAKDSTPVIQGISPRTFLPPAKFYPRNISVDSAVSSPSAFSSGDSTIPSLSYFGASLNRSPTRQ